MKKLSTYALGAAACLGVAAAHAVPITFSGSSTGPGGVPVTATASFDIVGGNLQIVLTNTSPSNTGQDVPGSTLTGLFFAIPGAPTLTPLSATVTSGSSIIQANNCNPGPCTGVTNVGGEFGYQQTSFPGSANEGIASSGYLTTGIPGNLGNFNGTNLDDPVSLDGINFGIVSTAAGFNPNGGLSSVPLIQNSVTFLLNSLPGNFSLSSISNVSFQYGTALSELNVPG
jgi:hypothetical protein